jgi:hypothetical protein
MTNFLTDLWNDLRAKRLWPVAVLLLAALVATPVVLSKNAETPDPGPAVSVADQGEAKKTEGPAQLAQVKLGETAEGSGSSLSSFDPRNPFAPPRKAIAAARRSAEGSSVSSTATSAGSTSGAGSISGTGSGGPIDGGPAGIVVTPGGGISTPPSIGGYTPPSGNTGGGDSDKAKAPEYTYVVDVSFRTNDRERTVKGLRKLDMLPDAESPLLIYMGVTKNAGSAVFMVDSTLQAAGEGTCKPSAADCASLYLGAGSEHEFTTDEGDSYTLRVDEIRRVKVGAMASASKKNKAIAGAAVRRNVEARDSVPPVLAELMKVSKAEGSDSIVDRVGR